MWERERQKTSALYCTSRRHTTTNTFHFNRRIYLFFFFLHPYDGQDNFYLCVCQCFMSGFGFSASNAMVYIFNFLNSFLTIQLYTQFLPLLLWGWVLFSFFKLQWTFSLCFPSYLIQICLLFFFDCLLYLQ